MQARAKQILFLFFMSFSLLYLLFTSRSVYASQPVADGYYALIPKCAPARAVTIKGGSEKAGANAYLYKYASKEKQIFFINYIGDDVYTITNKKSGKVLEATGTKNSSNVRQNTFHDRDRQEWVIKKTGSYYIFKNAASGKALTVKGSGNKNLANIYIYKYKKYSGQLFTLKKVKVNAKNTSSPESKTKAPKTSSSKTTETTSSGSAEYIPFDDDYLPLVDDDGNIVDVIKPIEDEDVTESKTSSSSKTSRYTCINGEKTLTAYLHNALVPCGRTLYIWGGGWDESDASVIGYQSKWKSFFNSHASSDYDYEDYKFEYGKGLDCSGFAAWVLYNTLYKKSGGPWLVYKSSTVASTYAKKGWVKLSTNSSNKVYHPGDIVSMDGHVWISLGQCSDKSLLVIHSSPKGVQISGTEGKAARLAAYYMKKYFPEWPYAARTVGDGYKKYLGKGVWKLSGSGSIMRDPDGLQKMSAEQVMKFLLGN